MKERRGAFTHSSRREEIWFNQNAPIHLVHVNVAARKGILRDKDQLFFVIGFKGFGTPSRRASGGVSPEERAQRWVRRRVRKRGQGVLLPVVVLPVCSAEDVIPASPVRVAPDDGVQMMHSKTAAPSADGMLDPELNPLKARGRSPLHDESEMFSITLLQGNCTTFQMRCHAEQTIGEMSAEISEVLGPRKCPRYAIRLVYGSKLLSVTEKGTLGSFGVGEGATVNLAIVHDAAADRFLGRSEREDRSRRFRIVQTPIWRESWRESDNSRGILATIECNAAGSHDQGGRQSKIASTIAPAEPAPSV